MTTAKISELTAAASAVSTDLYEIETTGGASKKATAAQLLTYIESAIGTAAFRALIDDASSAAILTTIGGQPLDSDLTAIAALSTTSYGRSLLALADAAALRTAGGLGTIATQDANNVTISGGAVTGITDITLADGGTGASLVDPNADRILFWDDSAGAMTWLTPGTGLTITTTTIDASGTSPAYICIWDQKTAGTAGGTFTSGAWRTRDLNTEHADTGNNASVGSNQITLAAGTYRCRITVPGYYCAAHQARLRDITNTATTLVGTSSSTERSSNEGTYSHSFISGRFTLAGSTVLEVQHQCSTTRADGFGRATNYGEIELYTIAEFWKE